MRDPGRLAGNVFDVLVVGAGIYGATIAWEAASRGLSVAIVDAGDFGGATSANSLKTVHGGLRSLQRGALGEMRQFIRERRTLLRIAPHLVEPLPFLIPTSRSVTRNRVSMRLALVANDLIAADRNRGLHRDRRLPPGRLLTRAELDLRFPGLPATAATGAALWHDAQMFSSERLVLGFIHSAIRAGAVAVNHCAVTAFTSEGGRVTGATVEDRMSGTRTDVAARVVVNAAGAWARALAGLAGNGAADPLLPRYSKALNLVTRRPAPPCGLGGLSDGRFFFQVPWRGRAIVGTSHTVFEAPADALRVTRRDVEALLADVNRAFPAVGLTPEDVTLVHRGVLPMRGISGSGEIQLAKESQVRDHAADGLPGLVSVIGVRYTTARHTAEQCVDRLFSRLDRPSVASRTASTVLAGGETGPVDAFLARMRALAPRDLTDEQVTRIARAYGAAAEQVLADLTAVDTLRQPLSPDCSVTAGEVRYAVRKEMAVTLADALLRRTEAGALGHPGRAALDAAASIMARELGWDQARVAHEIESVEDVYRIDD